VACEIVSHGPVVFVLWGTPGVMDLARILRELSTVEPRFGPVVFVGRVPPDAAPPEWEVRYVLDEKLPELLERCASSHLILEGEGLARTIQRSGLAGLTVVSRARKRIRIHARVEQVVRAVPLSQQSAVVAAFRRWLDLGLLSDCIADRPWLDPTRDMAQLCR
jgi:hypothetical protein